MDCKLQKDTSHVNVAAADFLKKAFAFAFLILSYNYSTSIFANFFQRLEIFQLQSRRMELFEPLLNYETRWMSVHSNQANPETCFSHHYIKFVPNKILSWNIRAISGSCFELLIYKPSWLFYILRASPFCFVKDRSSPVWSKSASSFQLLSLVRRCH